jgi:putative ABC transport system permease protein
MQPEYIELGPWQLFLAACLVAINLLLSLGLRLRLERQLLIASCRMVAQLLFVGWILRWVFALEEPAWILAMGLLMAGIASLSAVNRTRRRFPRIYLNSFISVMGAAFVVTSVAMTGIIRVEPWFEPQYFIPLLGMVLGNTLNGISLALDRFMEDMVQRQGQIESLLALGASKWEAARESLQEAARSGMIPTINAMMVMGLVSLPGMMTGQILAGADPMDAVSYQIVIVFMIAAAAALGVIGTTLCGFFSLFNARHQLRLNRLIRKR